MIVIPRHFTAMYFPECGFSSFILFLINFRKNQKLEDVAIILFPIYFRENIPWQN